MYGCTINIKIKLRKKNSTISSDDLEQWLEQNNSCSKSQTVTQIYSPKDLHVTNPTPNYIQA